MSEPHENAPEFVKKGQYDPERAKHRFSPRPLSNTSKPWHRQNGESRQAYEAFMAYLMLPPEDRTIVKACDVVGKSYSTLQKWAQMWHWVHRVAAYEEHYLLLKLESVEAERDLMWKSQARVAALGMDIVGDHFEVIMQQMAQMGENGQKELALKPDALARLFDISAKVQRMAVIGRIEGVNDAAEQAEKLAERYAEELADLIGSVVNDIGLSPEQQERAKEVLSKHLVGAAEES